MNAASLSYGQVEAETAIRTRYIRALEDEDFHILPGPTYTKGFLRAYAEYLGLDGQPFVDEFNSRHNDPRAAVEHTPIASRPRSRPQQRRRQRRESNLIMIALAAIVAVSVLVVLALRFPSPPTAPYNTNTGPGTTTARDHDGERHDPARRASTARHRASFRVVITLERRDLGRGDRRLARRQGGHHPGWARPGRQTGSRSTRPRIRRSRSRRASPSIVAFGAPGNVTLAINGHQVILPHVAAGQRLRLDSAGAHAA